MGEPTGHTGRLAVRTAALALSFILVSCASEGTTAAGSDGTVTATVTGPSDVSAAVIDFTSVSDINVDGGDVFSSATQGGTRAVIVLHAPGELRLRLTPEAAGVTPTATLVDISDANYEPANLAAWDVVVGS